MRAIEIQTQFGLDHLVQVDRPLPEPGPRQILLRMRAVALNYRDLLTVAGEYNPKQPLPLIPCSDGVGEVTAIGDGVERDDRCDAACEVGKLQGLEPTAGADVEDVEVGGEVL